MLIISFAMILCPSALGWMPSVQIHYLDHVKIVHRDPSGLLVADLKHGSFDPVPISRKYQDVITRML